MDNIENITSVTYNPTMDKVRDCFENKENNPVIDLVEKVIEGNDMEKIAKDIINKQTFAGLHREAFTQEKYERAVRGMLFESIALKYMESKGEPENPALSNLILEVSRNPKGFLTRVYDMRSKEYTSETNPSKRDLLLNEIRNLRQKIEDPNIPRLPSNSDAIAIQTREGEHGLELSIVGSIEVKNYNFVKSDRVNDVIKQLEKSKQDTLSILNSVLDYLPYYCNTVDLSVPKSINVVSKEDFQQTVVQPDVYRGENDPNRKYLEDMGIKVETMNITARQLAEIAKILEPEIRKSMIKLQRSGYRSKVR